MMGERVEEPTKHPAVVDLAVLEIQHFQHVTGPWVHCPRSIICRCAVTI